MKKATFGSPFSCLPFVVMLVAPSLASQLLQFWWFAKPEYTTYPCRSWLASDRSASVSSEKPCPTSSKR
jgi:hypothetical protein